MKTGIFKYQTGGTYQQAAKELKQLGLLDKFKELDKQDTGFKLSEISPELAKKYGDLQYHGKPNQKIADKMKESQSVYPENKNSFVRVNDVIYPEQGIFKNITDNTYRVSHQPLSQKQLNAFGLTPDSLAKIQPKEEVKTPVVDKPIVKTTVTGGVGYSNKPIVSGGSGYNQNSKNPYGKNTLSNEEFKKKTQLQRQLEALRKNKEANKDYYETLEKEEKTVLPKGKSIFGFKTGGVLKFQDGDGIMSYITPVWNKVKRDATRLYKEFNDKPEDINPKDKVKSVDLRKGKFQALNPNEKINGEVSMILPTTMDDALYTSPDKIKQGEYVIGVDNNGKVIVGENKGLHPNSKVGHVFSSFVNPVDSVAYNNQTKRIEMYRKDKNKKMIPVYTNLQSGGDGSVIYKGAPTKQNPLGELRQYVSNSYSGDTVRDSLNAFIKRNPSTTYYRVDNGRFTAKFKKDKPLTQQDYKDYLSDSFTGQGGMVLVQKKGGIFNYKKHLKDE